MFYLFLGACRQQPAKPAPVPGPEIIAASREKIRSLAPLLQNGDLVFRNGTDAVSAAARSFNRKDSSFSHCGLLFIEQDTAFVYHALGGIYNPSQKLVRQSLESFCDPAENNALGIYRYPLNPAESGKLHTTVKDYYKAGLRFDLYFNFQSDDRMYCAEFVFKSLNRALGNRLSGYVRTDTIPFGVTTDDLFFLPGCRLVKREKFIY